MNRLFILDGEAPTYEAELGKKDFHDPKIVSAQNLGEAEPLLPEEEIIFGTSTLVAGVHDVFEEEPLPDDNPLWNLENVVATPHNSAYSYAGQVAEICAANYARYIAGSPLDYLVDFHRGY